MARRRTSVGKWLVSHVRADKPPVVDLLRAPLTGVARVRRGRGLAAA